MIREAKPEDVPRMVEMGREFIANSVYRDEVVDYDHAAGLALSILAGSSGKILVAEEDGKVVGLIGFIVYPHYFTAKKTAMEMMWYVEPEYRKSMIAICLVRAAQRFAKEMGAEKMQMTAPAEEVGKGYEMMGFRKIEVGYQRSL